MFPPTGRFSNLLEGEDFSTNRKIFQPIGRRGCFHQQEDFPTYWKERMFPPTGRFSNLLEGEDADDEENDEKSKNELVEENLGLERF